MELAPSVCSKHLGGVERIVLYAVDDIQNVAYNSLSQSFSPPQLGESCSPVELHFMEGGASFEESVESGGRVTHRITCNLAGVVPEAVERLRRVARGGVVALLTTVDGGSYLVGYSVEAATDYPLWLHSAQVATHAARSSKATTTLVLESVDGWPSRAVVG